MKSTFNSQQLFFLSPINSDFYHQTNKHGSIKGTLRSSQLILAVCVPRHCVDTSCQAKHNTGSDQPEPSFIQDPGAPPWPRRLPLSLLPLPRFCTPAPSVRGSGEGYSNTVSLASPHCPLTIKTCVSAGQDESALLWLPLFFLPVVTLYFKLYLHRESRANNMFFSRDCLTFMTGLCIQRMTSLMQSGSFTMGN